MCGMKVLTTDFYRIKQVLTRSENLSEYNGIRDVNKLKSIVFSQPNCP